MGTMTSNVVKDAKAAEKKARPWVMRLARLGYATKGIIYAVLGVLALQAAWGARSAQVDQHEVLLNVLRRPFGQFLLYLLALGMLGYALWRLIQAVLDPEHEDKPIKRIGYGITAVSYTLLALAAVRLAMGFGQTSGDAAPRDITAQLLAQPWGPWLVGLVGVGLVILGIVEIYQAYRRKFERNFKAGEMSGEQREWAVRIGAFGYAAKGVIYGLVGSFLIRAALNHNADEAGGLGKALTTLAAQPYGPILLGVTAAGLLAYGVYALLLAQFRRMATK